MSLHKAKPTSPGRRFAVAVRTDGLYKGKPVSSLVDKKMKSGGRNNKGRITVRHRGGGHKQRYRIIDFKRDKDGVPGVVERIEYDPTASGAISWHRKAFVKARRSSAAKRPRSSRATRCRSGAFRSAHWFITSN
jgi:large subunit ribosomal protein L2